LDSNNKSLGVQSFSFGQAADTSKAKALDSNNKSLGVQSFSFGQAADTSKAKALDSNMSSQKNLNIELKKSDFF